MQKRIEIIKEETDKQIAEQKATIKSEMQTQKELEAKKEELVKKVQELEARKKAVEEANKGEMRRTEADKKREIDGLNAEYKAAQDEADDVAEFRMMRPEIESENRELQEKLADEVQRHNESKTKMDRDRIQATERLRMEMLLKIKETKANLSALNDEQQQTTTRLTIMQNSQLTQELEFQSKQTESLLVQNNDFRQEIETLKKDIEIHKEVEKELAKRSHFFQKVIKRYKLQIAELEASKTKISGLLTGGFDSKPAVAGLPGVMSRNKKHFQTADASAR